VAAREKFHKLGRLRPPRLLVAFDPYVFCVCTEMMIWKWSRRAAGASHAGGTPLTTNKAAATPPGSRHSGWTAPLSQPSWPGSPRLPSRSSFLPEPNCLQIPCRNRLGARWPSARRL